MKIRNGFISNSSSSSFILVYIPDDFDYDSHVEYMLDKYQKKGPKNYERFKKDIVFFKKSGIDDFVKKGRMGQFAVDDLAFFLEDYVVYQTTLDYEGYDTIKRIDKKFLEKIDKMADLSKNNIEKYKEVAASKNRKRQYLKDKMKLYDPYGEEEWDEDLDSIKDPLERGSIDESNRIKKFKEL